MLNAQVCHCVQQKYFFVTPNILTNFVSDPCNQKRLKPVQIKQYGRTKNHQAYIKKDIYSIFDLEGFDQEEMSFVLFKYTFGGLVKKNTKSYLVDTIAFISNIGGGLGLALGISIFSVLDCFTVKAFEKITAYKTVQAETPKQDPSQENCLGLNGLKGEF